MVQLMKPTSDTSKRANLSFLRKLGICVVSLGVLLFLSVHWWKPVLNTLVSFFGNNLVMIPVVLVVAGTGVWFCGHSMLRLHRELVMLEKDGGLNPDEQNQLTEPELRRRMEQWELIKRTDTMIYLRLRTIFESMEGGSRKSSRHRVLPKLSVLSDISLHAEMSRWDSASVTTILSFLLVLGILGTLTGVHGVLQEAEIEFTSLSAALFPSVCAVGSAILLMGLRSLYMEMVMQCLGRLDELTMTVLLPVLTPRTEEIKHDKIVDALANVPEILVEDTLEESAKESASGMENRLADIAGLLESVKKISTDQRSSDKKDIESLVWVAPPALFRADVAAFEENLQKGSDIIDSMERQKYLN